METITLAGGCFWCVEEIFKQLNGVETVISGYAGGTIENPSYKQVTTGTTGHAEAIQITFDPNIISLKDLLNIFFTVHDPTTLNQQGADIGTQYRSAIFYNNEEQKKIAEEVKTKINNENIYNNKIVTEITAFTNFYKAEDYHQNYYENNQDQMYCRIVIDPKVQKFKKMYFDRLKKTT